ncbi:hypothetical protein HYC85_002930 [Camellia sinensis]|uniref:RING-type domain-containing protein n=1 Tax=Camellia sinensis TaxID=4442 RepID=A0A7J7IAX5_CAMSI|nr:hypothetical protein HYC85_002930 [Camellia sinensis]
MSNEVLGVATQVMVMAIVISVMFLFVGIGVLVIIHICIVEGTSRRFGRSSAIGRGNFGSNKSMSKADVEKLPCFDFKPKDECESSSNSPVDCAVCLDNFKVVLLKVVAISMRVGLNGERASQTTDSGRFSEIAVELRQSQTAESESGVEMRESQSVESTTHLSDVGVEASENSL